MSSAQGQRCWSSGMHTTPTDALCVASPSQITWRILRTLTTPPAPQASPRIPKTSGQTYPSSFSLQRRSQGPVQHSNVATRPSQHVPLPRLPASRFAARHRSLQKATDNSEHPTHALVYLAGRQAVTVTRTPLQARAAQANLGGVSICLSKKQDVRGQSGEADSPCPHKRAVDGTCGHSSSLARLLGPLALGPVQAGAGDASG